MNWPASIGMADNGDQLRSICRLGLAPLYTDQARKFVFANFHFDKFSRMHDPWITHVCNSEISHPYATSEYFFLKFAYHFHHWLSLPGEFDLRTAGVIASLAIGVALGFFAAALKGKLWVRVLICTGLWLIIADAIFAGYFNSAYAEVPALLGVLICAVAAVYLSASKKNRRIPALIAFVLAGTVAITAKTQTATLIIPFALYILAFEVPLRRLRGRWLGRVLPLCGVIVFGLSAVWLVHNQRQDFAVINRTEFIFKSLLGHTSHPQADLKELNLPTHFDQYIGKSWWATTPIYKDPSFNAAIPHLTYGNAAKFLLHHPDRAFHIADQAADEFLKARPTNIGSYSKPDHYPYFARESRISFLTSGLQALGRFAHFPGYHFLMIIGSWLTLTLLAIRGIYAKHATAIQRGFAASALMLAGVFIMQFITAAFGEGIETTKHMVIAIFGLSLMLIFVLTAFIAGGKEPEGSARGRLEGTEKLPKIDEDPVS